MESRAGSCASLIWLAGACCAAIASQAPKTCDDVDVAAWTSAVRASPGFHVLCIASSASSKEACDVSDDEEACKADSSEGTHDAKVVACWDGMRTDCEDLDAAGFRDGTQATLLGVEEALIQHRPLANPNRYERLKKGLEKKGKWKGVFAFFRVDGAMPSRVRSSAELFGLVLAFEGGSFLWPGIEEGFRRNIHLPVKDSDALGLELLTRSLQPLIIEVSSFLDPAECQHIKQKADPHVAKSKVSHMDHDVGKPDTNWRSSSTYFMPSDDEVLQRLDLRVSSLTVTPVKYQEYAQVLRYGFGEAYSAHHDYFDINLYQKNEQIISMTKGGVFNRLATVFFYLTDVEDGGQTNFPRAGGQPQPSDFDDCSKGVSVYPQEGRIMIFYSLDAAARGDPYSLHGGCKVKNGTKWSANKWIWNKDMGFLGG